MSLAQQIASVSSSAGIFLQRRLWLKTIGIWHVERQILTDFLG